MSRRVLPMHGRDHCPGGADPIPCWPLGAMWRGFRETDQAIPTGDDAPIEWETWENTDGEVFEEVLTGDNVTSVRIVETGIYSIYSQYTWESFADNQLYWITLLTGWNFQETLYQTRYGWTSGVASISLSVIRTFRPFPSEAAGAIAEIQIQAGQTSGISRDIDQGAAQLEIIRLGPLPTVPD